MAPGHLIKRVNDLRHGLHDLVDTALRLDQTELSGDMLRSLQRPETQIELDRQHSRSHLMSVVVNNSHKAKPDPRMPQMPREASLGDMRLILLPPGTCDLRHRLSVNTFDVNLGQTPHEMALNSDRYARSIAQSETIGFFPTGTEIGLRVNNSLPGCVLEVNDGTLDRWMETAGVQKTWRDNSYDYRKDSVAADLARTGMRYLTGLAPGQLATDRLTLEAIALGIAARGIARFSSPDGDLDTEIVRWSYMGRRVEIDRAIDLIEARLCDADLSIADLAEAACLSSSHFSSVFRSIIGETPYAFILRRRAEHARDLIIGTSNPLAQIAFAAGFSSQAHMTVVIRRVCGSTPATMRK